jgi:hypothetical protein
VTRRAREGQIWRFLNLLGDGLRDILDPRLRVQRPIDILMTPGWISHLSLDWEEPTWVRWIERRRPSRRAGGGAVGALVIQEEAKLVYR